MSAKEFYRKNSLNIPEMPPEIWTTILRHATWDCELPCPSTYESIGTSSCTRQEQLRTIRKVLITKRYVVRVCKTWYTLASPFLYEHILLGRNRVLAPLRDGLARAALQDERVGWWTKHLDVQMRDATDNSETVFATLAEILTYLPNLCILTYSITGYGYFSPLPPIVLNSITSSGSLKCVHWYNRVAHPRTSHWTAFLQSHPEIESLDGNIFITLDAHINLKAVRIVHGYHISIEHETVGPVWATVDLPAVRSMFYDLSYVDPEDDDVVTFNRLGQSIEAIQLNFIESRNSSLLLSRFHRVFARMQAECTRLTQVVLAVKSWHMLGPTTPTLPPTVDALGIRVTDLQISKADVKRCFNAVLPLFVKCNPALKIIKFMEARNCRALGAHPLLLWQGLHAMEKSGVAIMDWADRLMVPPSCPDITHPQQQPAGEPASMASIFDTPHPIL